MAEFILISLTVLIGLYILSKIEIFMRHFDYTVDNLEKCLYHKQPGTFKYLLRTFALRKDVVNMNFLLFCLTLFLLFANFFAMVSVGVIFSYTYNYNSIQFDFGVMMVSMIISFVNISYSFALDSLDHTCLALLIQVGILMSCVLLIELFDKLNYKRNIKPGLQIKV